MALPFNAGIPHFPREAMLPGSTSRANRADAVPGIPVPAQIRNLGRTGDRNALDTSLPVTVDRRFSLPVGRPEARVARLSRPLSRWRSVPPAIILSAVLSGVLFEGLSAISGVAVFPLEFFWVRLPLRLAPERFRVPVPREGADSPSI